MADTTKKLSEDVGASVGALYAQMMQRRKDERKQKIEERKAAKAAEEAEDNESQDESEDGEVKLSKKDKRAQSLQKWQDAISELTGDDLEFIKPKKGRKKYSKWIDDELENAGLKVDKPKKKKKKNYNKEFEHELSMLKAIVADQNKFTADLSKRFQTMAGPNTRDAAPLNKTAVELAAAVNTSRSNALAMIKEIGNLKKTIANLTMDELKIQGKNAGGGDETDMTLLGSSMAMNMFGDNGPSVVPGVVPGNIGTSPDYSPVNLNNPMGLGQSQPMQQRPAVPENPGIYEEFDPAGWDNASTEVDPHIKYETTPKKTVIELNKETDTYRYKTINTETGEEITDYPNPTFTIKSVDEQNMMARDSFDNIYDLQITGN